MNNIDQDDAYDLIIDTINLLGGNLEHADQTHEEEENPKSEWIPPIIDGLKELLSELSDAEPIFHYHSMYSFNSNTATSYLESLIKELKEDLESHESIRSDDPQYSDPQEWWLSPLVDKIETIKAEIFWNAWN